MIKFCLVLEDETLRLMGNYGLISGSEWSISCFLNILPKAFFIERSYAETRTRLKQIVPYCVIRWSDKILTYRRKVDHTEQRLAEKWSIGFGGHIEPKDAENFQYRFDNFQTLEHALKRELREEVGLTDFRFDFIGFLFLNEPGDVERVHFGVLTQITCNTPSLPEIKPAEPEVDLFAWENIQDLSSLEHNWEAWSKVVIDNKHELLKIPKETL